MSLRGAQRRNNLLNRIMLNNFRFGLFRFVLTAQQNAALSTEEHVGALLRDRFGSALKHAVCPFLKQCRTGCILPRQCAYARLFETTQEGVSAGDLRGKDVYRPFVLEPPLDGKTRFAPGESLCFNLLLVGEGMDFLPYFALAFVEMGRHGFGIGRARWHLERVVSIAHSTADDGALVYDGARERFMSDVPTKDFAAVAAESQSLSSARITLELLTPLRVEDKNELAHEINTTVLTRALLRRISRLSHLWCGEELQLDYRGLLDRWGQTITCEAEDLRWEDWQRGSMRQRARLKLGGLRGRLHLSGEMSDLRPFLKLGEYLHVGKQTVFGLGKYVICEA
ncbi:MAG: CRISPR system precrRNA processing endoribonuclease RAMP protein Cas6 [Abditibacteriales bacterium]|nr:CRISPR system precrRNA processing endoribonuclease RAMP protein Cas6 [Abditibacteriales bacterium]MDW8365246.1 CRISPR system precrRNA processing endoribonuclease RAMP protein Cas6 [Abditibacteriales bacterium]